MGFVQLSRFYVQILFFHVDRFFLSFLLLKKIHYDYTYNFNDLFFLENIFLLFTKGGPF